jgi:hypothetical protein
VAATPIPITARLHTDRRLIGAGEGQDWGVRRIQRGSVNDDAASLIGGTVAAVAVLAGAAVFA